MATQSDLVVRNRKLPNRSFLYLPYIFPETPEEVEHNGPAEKNWPIWGKTLTFLYIKRLRMIPQQNNIKSERIVMHHVLVLLILKQCQAPWGAKKNFIEKTFKINVTNRFLQLKPIWLRNLLKIKPH